MNLQTAEPARFAAAMHRFDEENSRDPNHLRVAEGSQPRELVYAQWVSDWILRLSPNASELLRLAARAAHLCRWSIARNAYPATRAGYLRWREELKKLHAQKAGTILREVGYLEEEFARVQKLIRKQCLPDDPEAQVLEDALCLVFLEHQFAELAQKSSDEKMINALSKTWLKMSAAARALALELQYGSREKQLLERALGRRA